MKERTQAIVSGGVLLITLVVNYLGATGVINGLSQKAISDMYPTLLTPAAFTFSIWSIIYTLIIASIIIMIVKSEEPYYKRAIPSITGYFWITCGFNIVWIITFSYKLIGLSSIVILLLLLVLIMIVQRLGKIQTDKRWLLPATFGLYSGWLCIATVVNITAFLVQVGWDGFGIRKEIWALSVICLATLLTLIITIHIKNALVPLPIAWAYMGIYRNLVVEFETESYQILKITVILGMIFLLGVVAFQFYRNRGTILPIIQESATS